MNDLLTILVPVFGRPMFTDRLRAFADMTGQKWLKTFDVVSEISAYHRAVLAQLADLKSEFVMLADNDDLPIREGCLQCVSFLLGNDDFVAAYGRIAGFALRGNGAYGTINRYAPLYTPNGPVKSYEQTSPADRVLAGFNNESLAYAIHRTETLRAIYQDVVAMDLRDYQSVHRFLTMAPLMRGKIKAFDEIYYCRQYDTYIDFPNRFSFPGRLMSNQFARERDAILDTICGDDDEFEDRVRAAWQKWWEMWLRRNYGSFAEARRFAKQRWPGLVKRFKNMPWLVMLPPELSRLRFFLKS